MEISKTTISGNQTTTPSGHRLVKPPPSPLPLIFLSLPPPEDFMDTNIIIGKKVDIKKAFTSDSPPLDCLWEGGPKAGSVGSIVGIGAVGKSTLMLQIAIAVASSCENRLADILQIKITKPGKVLYLSAEDDVDVITKRLEAIREFIEIKTHEAIIENLTILSTVGYYFDLMSQDTINDTHIPYLIEKYKGARLIIFDTISRFHSKSENDNGHMAQLIVKLEHIAQHTGAAVLFLHHIGKTSAREARGDDQHAPRGAGALTENPRWGAFLQKMTSAESQKWGGKTINDDETKPIGDARRGFYLRFGVPKHNYGPPQKDRWFVRQKGGILVPEELWPITTNNKEKKQGKIRNEG